jgi:putative transposase
MNTYALTTATYQRRALLLRTANAELLLRMLFHYRDQGRYQLHGFAIMPEHMHVLLSPSSGQTIERCAQCIKGGFSHEARAQFSGEIWQPGFHAHRIRDNSDFYNQLKYIAANPERRHLPEYKFVHTRFPDRLDPMPEEFKIPASRF